MLILSRHRDERIIIGDDIVITVIAIRGDKVRLGIAAPAETSVHRSEVYEAIQANNRAAAELTAADRAAIAARRAGLPSQARPPSEPEPRRKDLANPEDGGT